MNIQLCRKCKNRTMSVVLTPLITPKAYQLRCKKKPTKNPTLPELCVNIKKCSKYEEDV